MYKEDSKLADDKDMNKKVEKNILKIIIKTFYENLTYIRSLCV